MLGFGVGMGIFRRASDPGDGNGDPAPPDCLYLLDAPQAVLDGFGATRLDDVPESRLPDLMGQVEFDGSMTGTWAKVAWDSDAGQLDEAFPTRNGVRAAEVELDMTGWDGGSIPLPTAQFLQIQDTEAPFLRFFLGSSTDDGQTSFQVAGISAEGSGYLSLVTGMADPYARIGLALDFDNEQVWVVVRELDGTTHNLGWLDKSIITFGQNTGAVGVLTVGADSAPSDSTLVKVGMWTSIQDFTFDFPAGSKDRCGNEITS